MVWVMFWGDNHEVLLQKTISVTLAFKELRIVAHVVDTGEYLLEVAKPELLFFEIENYVQVVFICCALVSLIQLSH